MSDNSNTGATATPDTQATPVHRNPVARVLARFSLTQLTLALLIIVFTWQWLEGKQQLNQIQQLLAQRLAEVDGNSKAAQTLTLQSQELVRELGGKLSLLESKFAETQNQRSALETLYQDLSSSRDQMVLAEVEQLLLIAGQQLQLAANVKAALIAMQQADARLKRLDRAALNNLRHAISLDIDKLRALPEVDISGINTRLDALISLVGRLPLQQNIRASDTAPVSPPADGGKLSRLWDDIWRELRSLVRIENTYQNELPLLSPTQSFFLRENLKLRLLSARLALLSRDENSFKHDIKAAQEWIKLYFDLKSADGAQALNMLNKLNVSGIRIELPDISSSLEQVRHYRATREKAAR